MTILSLMGETGSVTPGSGGVYEVTTGDSGQDVFRSGYARCAMRLAGSAAWMRGEVLSAQAAVGWAWTGYYATSIIITRRSMFEMFAGATAQIRLTAVYHVTALTLELDYWDGAAWVNAGTHSMSNDLSRYEVFCNKTTGVLQLYIEGALYIDETLSLSHLSGFTHCRWYGSVAGAGYVSEMSAATTANAVAAVKTRYVNGNGAQTAWTGDSTGVDELVYSDADGITSAAGNDVETFTQTGPDLEDNVILAVGLGIRGKAGASGPTGQQGVLRIGGTDYTSPTDTLGTGYGAFCPVWETNPATAAAWTGAAAEALEIGVKSIT
jgi:hypothetical protein